MTVVVWSMTNDKLYADRTFLISLQNIGYFLGERMIEVVENRDLKDYVAVIPSVCVGNVGQLASDLLISSLNLKRLGYVWHRQILAFCGAEPFGRNYPLSTACEIFFSERLKLVVFQIRSALKKDSKCLMEEICGWLKENKVRQVILLTGMSAHRRKDQQLIGEPLRYVFCPITKAQESKDALRRGWVEFEMRNSESNSTTEFPMHVPGAGAAFKWFHKCIEDKIQCSILLEFCSDGNNVPDALKLVDYLDEWLLLKSKQPIDHWTMPTSWNLLFGSQPPAEIFN